MNSSEVSTVMSPLTVEAPVETLAPVREKTTRDILLNAARLIEERGWTQGALERGGALCVIGAIDVARHGSTNFGHIGGECNPFRDPATHAVAGHLGMRNGLSVAFWNDRSFTTQADVIAALRDAAANA